jgi:hypothetical protein
MIRAIVCLTLLILSARLGQAEPPIIRLRKDHFGALSAAIRQMQQIGRSYKGKQVVIEDKGDVFYVSFMDDPIDVAVAGNQNSAAWVVRKKDLKVVRPLLNR